MLTETNPDWCRITFSVTSASSPASSACFSGATSYTLMSVKSGRVGSMVVMLSIAIPFPPDSLAGAVGHSSLPTGLASVFTNQDEAVFSDVTCAMRCHLSGRVSSTLMNEPGCQREPRPSGFPGWSIRLGWRVN
jgi:hypothetical protein